MVKNLPLYKEQWCYSCAYASQDTPKYVKAILAGALGYLILPIDVIPDTIAGLGWVDDVAILGIAFKVANRYIKTTHEEQAKKLFPFGR